MGSNRIRYFAPADYTDSQFSTPAWGSMFNYKIIILGDKFQFSLLV